MQVPVVERAVRRRLERQVALVVELGGIGRVRRLERCGGPLERAVEQAEDRVVAGSLRGDLHQGGLCEAKGPNRVGRPRLGAALDRRRGHVAGHARGRSRIGPLATLLEWDVGRGGVPLVASRRDDCLRDLGSRQRGTIGAVIQREDRIELGLAVGRRDPQLPRFRGHKVVQGVGGRRGAATGRRRIVGGHAGRAAVVHLDASPHRIRQLGRVGLVGVVLVVDHPELLGGDRQVGQVSAVAEPVRVGIRSGVRVDVRLLSGVVGEGHDTRRPPEGRRAVERQDGTDGGARGIDDDLGRRAEREVVHGVGRPGRRSAHVGVIGDVRAHAGRVAGVDQRASPHERHVLGCSHIIVRHPDGGGGRGLLAGGQRIAICTVVQRQRRVVPSIGRGRDTHRGALRRVERVQRVTGGVPGRAARRVEVDGLVGVGRVGTQDGGA